MEYIFYIIPYYKYHESNKYCVKLDKSPEDLETFLNSNPIEEHFENKNCCLKCALYAQLFYNQMIVEKKEIKYTSKSYNSKFSIQQLDITTIFENINHNNTLFYANYDKVKSVYNDLLKKRAYKLSDIEAYDITKEILEYIIEKYEKYNVLIFYEQFI